MESKNSREKGKSQKSNLSSETNKQLKLIFGEDTKDMSKRIDPEFPLIETTEKGGRRYK